MFDFLKNKKIYKKNFKFGAFLSIRVFPQKFKTNILEMGTIYS